MRSAVLPRNPEYSVVALLAVLGSTNVEMSATQSLVIHGSMAYKLVKVGFGET